MANSTKPKRVTLFDVAKYAGFSHTTVSMVIQNNSRISEETRTKVLSSIKELNYRPNHLARQLAGGKNNTIAIITTFFSSHFEMEFMRGLQMAMGLTDFRISQHSTRGREDVKDQLFDEILNENRAEGIITLNLRPSPKVLAEYSLAKIPIVLVEEDMENAIVIKTDNFSGAFKATQHLVQKGYKTIALLTGSLDSEEPGSSPKERYAGYCEALKAAGRKINPALIYQTEDYEIEDGMHILDKMRIEHPEIDAIFCSAGDMVAFGLMRCAKLRGIKIPEQLAIIGYDDHFVSEIVTPALSTVRQPIYLMGSTALTLLVQAIEEPLQESKRRTIYSPELIIRETT